MIQDVSYGGEKYGAPVIAANDFAPSSGGAAAPFTTGILAQAVGTFVLHPIAIGLFSVM